MTQFHTAESVSEGHPDKLCDWIADGILEVCLRHDPLTRMDGTILLSNRTVAVAGTLDSTYRTDVQGIVFSVLAQAGYAPEDWTVANLLQPSSREEMPRSLGMVGGYACAETPAFLPLSEVLANRLTDAFSKMRMAGVLSGFSPSAKAQVVVEYDETGRALRLEQVALSTVLSGIPEDEACWRLSDRVLYPALQALLPDEDTKMRFFVQEGEIPRGISGAIAGKSPEHWQRTGAYLARYIAKNLVAARLASRCQVTLLYGKPSEPATVQVDTFGTGTICADDCLADAVERCFPLTIPALVEGWNLPALRYSQTVLCGHFGKPGLPWERLDRVKKLRMVVL